MAPEEQAERLEFVATVLLAPRAVLLALGLVVVVGTVWIATFSVSVSI